MGAAQPVSQSAQIDEPPVPQPSGLPVSAPMQWQPMHSLSSSSSSSSRSSSDSEDDAAEMLRALHWPDDASPPSGFDILEPIEEDEDPISDYVSALQEETGMRVAALNELEASGLLAKIPREEDGGKLTSLGSIAHATQQCAPCLFASRGFCVRRLACSFCHLKHAEQPTLRIRRRRRATRRAGAAAAAPAAEVCASPLLVDIAPSPAALEVASAPSTAGACGSSSEACQ
mmetsp:Transcript_82430/g.218727  ORF Transcript_82430/g.218727 Transcript_82430/m.218727 type:complete len:230 (-) Transcript_82430:79-768(-)